MSASDVLPLERAVTAVDPKAHADPERLHANFAWLRANQPLGRAEIDGYDPFWLVTKHADILHVSRNNDLFHNGDRQTTFTSQEGDRVARKLTGGSPHLVRTLVQMDAPDHPKYRVLTQAWFLPQNIRKLEADIRELAKRHVDHMAELGGQCDFVRDVALHYPLRVIMRILGVPPEHEPRMLKLTQELFGAADPELSRGGGAALGTEEAIGQIQSVLIDFFTYFNAITEGRRARPKDDLASVIANGRIDGHPIPQFDAVSYYVIVATAGHDTTSSSTAGAIWALCENPDQFAKVKADPSLVAGLVDESIRWTTPVRHFMRSATADTELRDRRIAEGDWLMLCYPSGNRDEEVFEDPFAFRVDRSPNRHLAFGYGAHVCLGQHLAKMEMRILWEELLPRLESVEFAGQPRLSEAGFVNGPKHLPIRYRMH